MQRAHTMQVDVLAITDHDTTAGIPPAQAYQATQSRALRIISGVEISTSWHNFDIHVLGLNINIDDALLKQRLATQQARRLARAEKIDEKLRKAGVEGILEAATILAGTGQITRAHFARAMVQRGICKDMDSVFKKYLGKGKRAHVKPEWISVAEAVEWISDAGGQAVLAHPGHYDMTTKWLRRLIGEFSAAGGHGMEVIHSHLTPQRKTLLASLAEEYKLCASAGSDFHYPNRWTELGKNLRLPEALTPIWQHWQFLNDDQRVSAL